MALLGYYFALGYYVSNLFFILVKNKSIEFKK